jgi:outer membrane lipoprotein SlyB
MKMKATMAATGLLAVALLSGCQTPGQELGANVYNAGEVNSRQEAETVQILAVLPAKVQVSNAQNQHTAQVVGGILGALAGGIAGANVGRYHQTNTVLGAAGGGVAGAAAGSLVPSTELVDGVSIAYKQDGKVFNSAEVGQVCQFQPGTAIMISTGPNETRIQPNATCPPPKQG